MEAKQPQTRSLKYKKGGDAGNKGVVFQVSLLTVSLLNGLRLLPKWRLSTENKIAGKFDDVILESPEGDTLLQAKHRQNQSNKITFQELMSTNPKNDNFSLAKYFISYQEIKNRFNIRNLVICTNVKFDDNVSDYLNTHIISSESLLHHEDDTYRFHTFNDKILTHLEERVKCYRNNVETSDGSLKDFLNHLQFYSDYPSGQRMREVIENLLVLVDQPKELCALIYDKVLDWFQRENGVYWTEVHAKAKFLELRRDRYWQKLKKYKVSFKKNLDFQDETRIYNLVSKYGLFLKELKITEALDSARTKTMYGHLDEGLELLEAFELPDYVYLIITCAIPLTKEMTDKLEVILQQSQYKKVILLTDDNTKAFKPEQAGSAVIDKAVIFEDLSETSKMKLLATHITFQGKRVILEKLFVTKNCNEFLDEDMMEKLIKKEDIKVGAPNSGLEERLANFYVNRKITRRKNITDEVVYEEMIHEISEKVVIISDCAGMGKSTMLTKLIELVKTKKPQTWVIKVDLNSYTKILMKFLEEGKRNITMLELLDSKDSTRLRNEFEKRLYLQNEKIMLMLDGVDEVCPRYENLVLGLLVECQKAPNYAKIIVTTRPNMAGKLEETLEVKSFSMQPFTRLNQRDFLVRYWMHNLKAQKSKKERCARYAQALITKISSLIRSEENHFVGVPLHVRMLAEIFQKRPQNVTDWEGCSEYLDRDDSEPRLVDIPNIKSLYEMFIAKKRDLFINKGTPSGNSKAYNALTKQFNECLTYHKCLGLNVILDKSKLDLLPTSADADEQLSEIGIVQSIDGKFHFLHRTFAEFFAAQALLEELKKEVVEYQKCLLDEVLINPEYSGTRTFLDCFLLENTELPSTIFEKYQFLKCPPNAHKLLHVLAKDGCVATFKLIINCVLDSKEKRVTNTLNDLQRLVKRDGVDIKDADGNTPLHHAVRENHLKMVDLLVSQRANVAITDGNGFMPLHIAAEKGHLDVIKLLVKTNNVKLHTANKQTMLHLAAKEGRLSTLDFLLKTNVEANARDDDERTPLHFAAERGGVEVTKSLVRAGAIVDAIDKEGRNALHLAADWCQLDTIKFLAGQGGDINFKDDCGRTALHLAAARGHLDSVIYLLKLNAEINIWDDFGRTPLYSAAEWGALDVVKLLMEMGAQVDAKDDEGQTAMHRAAADGATDLIKLLKEVGGNVSIQDNSGNTPLHSAISRGHLDVVKFLFEVSEKEHINVEKVLHVAATRGYVDVIQYLVEQGAYVNFLNSKRQSILHLAAQEGHYDLVEYLVKSGVMVNLVDVNGRTPLHLAALRGNLEVVKLLVERYRNVHVMDNDGCIALHLAVSKGHRNVVEYLDLFNFGKLLAKDKIRHKDTATWSGF